MRTEQFDFDLPRDLIALRPADPRDSARLLVVHEEGRLEHARIADLPRFLARGDVVVLNDTKVIPARLHGVRTGTETAPKIELLLHRRLGPDRFLAFARPARKLKPGNRLLMGKTLTATVAEGFPRGEFEIRFDLAGPAFDAVLRAEGELPLPPYIANARAVDVQDFFDYQTVFAVHDGSVAAPTAGLHFTPSLLARLANAGIDRETVTLHVGPGTFLPVSAEDTQGHRMHAEAAVVSASVADRLNRVRRSGGRLVAVGTTVLRTLESAAEPDGYIRAFEGDTDIFITPGYAFRTAEVLLTNFHLPRSTLFMLVSAFCGLDVMKAAYAEAIRELYRFYSYGDACLLFRRPQ